MNLLSAAEVEARLENYPEWEFDSEDSLLVTDMELESFHDVVDFLHEVSHIADDLNHHPDVLIHDVKFVTIFVSTHEPEGITEKDFEFIAKLEEWFENAAEGEGHSHDHDEESE